MTEKRTEYQNPSFLVLSLSCGNVLCISGEGFFDDWIDDGEVPVTSEKNTFAR